MRERGRLGYYLLLNVIVSALTTWVVLMIWSRANPPVQVENLSTTAVEGVGTVQAAATPSAGEAPENPGGIVLQGQLEISGVIGAGDLESERVVITHVGEVELSLTGWSLKDEDGNTFVFPGLTMFSGGAVTVYTKAGVNTVVELFWGLGAPVWSTGETVTLLDASGNVHATYIVP